ncbi:hypothetical protein BpHYR1_041066 [Brachionus plicatilis]|uniref:Potassium channel tetramerisation-type BTB domain-containing protein n=1 Tax=Brachionus plicatilis TaxID=10195 RepID=A0A3M7QXA8_BRAPC|nr:hypothetical protein BpHYR1_041066 [Brachionus plicatilis]
MENEKKRIDETCKSLSTIKESFEDKIEIIKNDFDCLINLANKMSLVDGFVKPKYDENKAIFIDRNSRYFECILDYLRMANTDFEYELASSIDKNELLKEGLVDLIEFSLNSISSEAIILKNKNAGGIQYIEELTKREKK